MFVFGYIIFYLVLTILFGVAQLIIAKSQKQFDENVSKNSLKWSEYFRKAVDNDDFSINNSALRKLKKPVELNGFFEELRNTDANIRNNIIDNNFDRIISLFRKTKDETIKADFAYQISLTEMDDAIREKYVPGFMKELLKGKSIYLRENALRAIYTTKNVDTVIDALHWMSDQDIFHNEKLIIDGLLSFAGDKDELCRTIVKRLKSFNDNYRDAMVGFFFAYRWNENDDELIELLNDNDAGIETICAIARNIGRNKCEKNKRALIDLIKKYSVDEQISPAIVAISFMGQYEGDQEVIDLLLTQLSSKDWYIRMNSAKSLIESGLSKEQIEEVLNGNDKFAKDALEYMLLEVTKTKEKEGE